MTDMPNAATPRSVRDTLWKAYKETTDFEGSLYSALFAALTMLEKQEARLAALEAARNGSDEKHEAAPIAVGHAVLAVGEPILELEGELKDDMWTYLLAAGLNELAVRVVIYAESEAQS